MGDAFSGIEARPPDGRMELSLTTFNTLALRQERELHEKTKDEFHKAMDILTAMGNFI